VAVTNPPAAAVAAAVEINLHQRLRPHLLLLLGLPPLLLLLLLAVETVDLAHQVAVAVAVDLAHLVEAAALLAAVATPLLKQ
jgi:hypothetical protein